ncbi:MAG: hypothetical protein H5T63_04550, partial [Chloroflexi bacterium]|nr:hypothetical protein [Chloroflexota bacterium]
MDNVSSGTKFAEVVVRSPLGRDKKAADRANLQQTFHYSIPARAQGKVVPGQLVWVPFGPRQLPGI